MNTAHDERVGTMPHPPRTCRWVSWRARVAGRRDARRQVIADEKGHRPYTLVIAARALRGQAHVDGRLHEEIRTLDERLAHEAERVIELERRQRRIDDELNEEAEPRRLATGVDAVSLGRRARRLETEKQTLTDRAHVARVELHGLLALRRHFLDTARAAALLWEARYREIVARYDDGYRRRAKDTTSTPVPPLHGGPVWIDGDLPLLVATIDPEAERLISVELTRFVPGANAGPRAR